MQPDSLTAYDLAIQTEEQLAALCESEGDRAGAIRHGNEKARLRVARRDFAHAVYGFGYTSNGGTGTGYSAPDALTAEDKRRMKMAI